MNDFLACAHRAARSRPPPTLSSAQRAIHEARTRPPPWLSPAPVAVVMPQIEAENPPPPTLQGRPDAMWPKLHALMAQLAARSRPLPYLPELSAILGTSPDCGWKAMKALLDYGYVTREIRHRPNAPAEMRVVIVENGAVLVTRGWV